MFYRMINQANFRTVIGRPLNDFYMDKQIAYFLKFYTDNDKPDDEAIEQQVIEKFYADGVFPDSMLAYLTQK